MTRHRFTVQGKWGRHAAAEFELIEDLEDTDGDHLANDVPPRGTPAGSGSGPRRP